jgi:uncharacterized membrane protein SirB2
MGRSGEYTGHLRTQMRAVRPVSEGPGKIAGQVVKTNPHSTESLRLACAGVFLVVLAVFGVIAGDSAYLTEAFDCLPVSRLWALQLMQCQHHQGHPGEGRYLLSPLGTLWASDIH